MKVSQSKECRSLFLHPLRLQQQRKKRKKISKILTFEQKQEGIDAKELAFPLGLF